MQDLRVSLVQTELAWEAPADNRAHFELQMDALPATDLVILPEMFTTGFSMDAERLAEPHAGETCAWMLAQAQAREVLLTGSVITEEDGSYYNRMYLAFPDGQLKWYDKRHLFRMAREHEHYAPGKAQLIVAYKGWRICPQVCYDLRFPVFSRNTGPDGRPLYDLLLYVANWPAKRSPHWRRLLAARGIENLCYVAAVNRVGDDENGIHYSGDSAITDWHGDRRVDLRNTSAHVTLALSYADLQTFREKFPAWQDADGFELQ